MTFLCQQQHASSEPSHGVATPGTLQMTLFPFNTACLQRCTFANTPASINYGTSKCPAQEACSSAADFPVTEADEVVHHDHAVSPAPTEIVDDDSPVAAEDITSNIKMQGIEIRDFASFEERRSTALKPVPEIFDQYVSLAEFEYRLGVRTPRRLIHGKILRRLLAIGWISDDEVERQYTPMDIESLALYDMKVAQDVLKNGTVYPWRALRSTAAPTLQQRKEFIARYEHHFLSVDAL